MDMPPDDRRPGLQPPRFRLASLMALMVLLGIFFAFVHYVGLYGSAIAVLFLLCLAAHVAGNALGTRLRAIGSTPADAEHLWREAVRKPPMPQPPASPGELRKHRPLGKPIVAITGLGAIGGGVVSSWALVWLAEPAAAVGVIALGIAAGAVLGAIWSFAAASFVQVLISAWFDATRAPRKP